MLTIHQTLPAIRKSAGFTQAELAKAIGKSVTYVSYLEHDLARPSLATIEKIATALGVPPLSLFDQNTITKGLAL